MGTVHQIKEKNKQENKHILCIKPKKCQASVNNTRGFCNNQAINLFFDQVYLLFQDKDGLNQVPEFLNTDVS